MKTLSKKTQFGLRKRYFALILISIFCLSQLTACFYDPSFLNKESTWTYEEEGFALSFNTIKKNSVFGSLTLNGETIDVAIYIFNYNSTDMLRVFKREAYDADNYYWYTSYENRIFAIKYTDKSDKLKCEITFDYTTDNPSDSIYLGKTFTMSKSEA